MRPLRQPAGIRTHAHTVSDCPNWQQAEAMAGGPTCHEVTPRDRDVEPATLDEILGTAVDEQQSTLEAFE